MKTTIWASCPKCQTELKIDTHETELVQIECPDCHKVFAAKVPPRSAAPVHEVFAQMPVLPPFQPAQVHYQPRSRSDDSMSPVVLTALIVVCASAILIPLGFGGYYVYGKLSEASQVTMSDSAKSTPAISTNSNFQPSTSFSPATDTTAASVSLSAQGPASRNTLPTTDSFRAGSSATMDSAPQPDPTFGVPDLNPPSLIRPESSSAATTPTPNSTPMASSPPIPGVAPPTPSTTTTPPTPTGSVPAGTANTAQGQVSVAGAGTSKSGLPVQLHRFIGSSGVMIFVLHSKGQNASGWVQELQRIPSVAEVHADGGSDYTTIGLRYSGSVDSVAKGIRFGKVSYVDEESRSIHIQVN